MSNKVIITLAGLIVGLGVCFFSLEMGTAILWGSAGFIWGCNYQQWYGD